MSRFFIVKGELAAWALGLDQDEVVPAADVSELREAPDRTVPKRRKRRLGHEAYRLLTLPRREALAR